MYLRASKKQLEYIAKLSKRLDITNPTLYSKYILDDASKLINKLKRKLEKQKRIDNQTTLL